MKILKKIFFQKKKENETSLPKINPKNYKKTLLFTHYEEFYSYHYVCKVTAI